MYQPRLFAGDAAYVRIDVTRTPEDGFSVSVWAVAGPGHVAAVDADRYERLTAAEAVDVATAALVTEVEG